MNPNINPLAYPYIPTNGLLHLSYSRPPELISSSSYHVPPAKSSSISRLRSIFSRSNNQHRSHFVNPFSMEFLAEHFGKPGSR